MKLCPVCGMLHADDDCVEAKERIDRQVADRLAAARRLAEEMGHAG